MAKNRKQIVRTCRREKKEQKQHDTVNSPSKEEKDEWKKRKGFHLIHDNGGRPFAVRIGTDSKSGKKQVLILNNRTDERLARYCNYVKVWVPADISGHKELRGNSILVRLSKNRHVYIGAEIYEFKTSDGDEILKYVSNVGNSNVPYPYAIGRKYVYIMLDKVYCLKSKFDKEDLGSDEVYRVYYEWEKKKQSIAQGKMTICKQVSKRLW